MLLEEEDEEDEDDWLGAAVSVTAEMLCRAAKAAGLAPMSPLSSASELYAEREDSGRDMMSQYKGVCKSGGNGALRCCRYSEGECCVGGNGEAAQSKLKAAGPEARSRALNETERVSERRAAER
jgi:hypothetical protein